jgi:hypothetical protein
MTPLRAPVT